MSLRAALGVWVARAQAPVDPASLVAFRVFFGLLATFGALRFLAYGWVERFFVRPDFFFHYWGFEWVTPLSAFAMHAAFVVLALLGVLVTLGLFYRVAIALYVALFTYVELIDVTNYLNHYYLVSLLGAWMCLMPLSEQGSLDARWRLPLRGGGIRRWMLWALRLQVAAVYVHAGLAKLSADWLLHGQPLGIWLSARADTPLLGPYFALPWVAVAMSWAGFLYDLTIPVWLSWRRSRPWAFAVLLMFHGMTHVLFRIGLFPLIMTAAATVFFAPSWPRRLLRGERAWRAPELTSAPRRAHALAGVALVVLLVQWALPLRAYAYGGNVLWHEQGMRWSWRVMCREKAGSVTFRVRWVGRERERLVSPSRYLTDYQEREMSGQPDLILQLAHRVAADFRARGHEGVEVRVDATSSLNGRPAAPLIDPGVDLARVHDGLARARWIAPAPSEPPLPLRAPRLAHGGQQ